MSGTDTMGTAEIPNVKFLDLALHMDEGGAPHVHVRKVWVALDKDGEMYVSQRKALEDMRIQRPNPDKKNSRYNNLSRHIQETAGSI